MNRLLKKNILLESGDCDDSVAFIGSSPRSDGNRDDQEAESVGYGQQSTALQVTTRKRPIAVSGLDNYMTLGAAFALAPRQRGRTMRTKE